VPSHEETQAIARRSTNPVHTTVFGILFAFTVVLLPLVTGGLAGLLLAPIAGGALWGLYRLTLPRSAMPKVTKTAGASPCPACGSMQTDRAQFRGPDDPIWQCFACDHRW
jgi:hypothetical protein